MAETLTDNRGTSSASDAQPRDHAIRPRELQK